MNFIRKYYGEILTFIAFGLLLFLAAKEDNRMKNRQEKQVYSCCGAMTCARDHHHETK
jgi:hypothetical protein